MNTRKVLYAIAGLGLLASPAPGEFYTYTDLGTLPRMDNAEAFGVTPDGHVTGRSGIGPGLPGQETGRGFLWSPSTPNGTTGSITIDLGPAGTAGSTGAGINASGEVAGRFTAAGGDTHAFRSGSYAAINPATDDLNTITGTTSSGFAINDSGQVAGYASYAPNGQDHPFLTTATGKVDAASRIDSAIGGYSGFAFGINAGGQAVGFEQVTSASPLRAFRYTPGTGLVILDPTGGSSIAQGIDSSGAAVGDSYDATTQVTHAVIWAPNSTTSTILGAGVLPGDTFADALAINGHGVIVGNSSKGDTATSRGFLYEHGQMFDLAGLVKNLPAGDVIQQVRGLNDDGQIVGIVVDPAGIAHAMLLTPAAVPEPAALVLMGTGGLVVLVAARRRRRAG